MNRLCKHASSHLLIAVAILQLAGSADVHEIPQFNQGQERHLKVGPPSSLMRDKSHIQDRDHLREHLEGTVDFDTVAIDMSPSELQFHYFHSHDTDKNRRLDGLELMQSILHVDREWVEGVHPDEETRAITEEMLVEIVDKILRDDDMNRDGYVDYIEFSRGVDDQENRDDDDDDDDDDYFNDDYDDDIDVEKDGLK